MSSPKDQRPASFGDRFREEGLSGILKKKPKDPKTDPNEMHFLEHLEELRWVILKSVVAFLVGCIGVAIFMQDSVKLLQMPLIKAVEDFGEIGIDLQSIGLEQYTKPLEKKEIGLGELRKAREQDLIDWGITDPHHQNRIINHFANGSNRNLLQVIRSYSPIFIAMKICFLGGIGLSLPMILYFVGGFVVPGLTFKEKKIFFPGCIAATFLFLAGASMTYFFILPLSLAFTIEFSFNVLGLDVYRPEAGNYYSTVIWMTFAVGIAFQFPLVLILLIRVGIITAEKLRKSRRFVLVILMVSAALITPGGDPVSLCILTIPLYILFELSILVGSLIEKRNSTHQNGENTSSGISGSIFLILSLILFGGAGFWLYQNWDQAESFFLQLEEKKENPSKEIGSTKKKQPLPHVESDYFLLELTPISNEKNSSAINESMHFRARIPK